MKFDEVKTPCFVLETEKLVSNIRSFKKALNKRFKQNVLGYSVKTNSTPVLLDILRNEGCFAEVVSYDEYKLARCKQFKPNRIVYNGPLKDKATFIDAIVNGSYVNIDTKRELDWLEDLPKDHSYEVGLRLNLNLMDISPEDCKDGEEFSRFGFSDENGEFEEALSCIYGLENISIAGLHLHRTSKTRSLSVYKNICNYAVEVVRKYDLDLKYLDLGGGFYGDMPGKPTYDDYVEAIAENLSTFMDISQLTLIVEPGNAIIASPFSFYSSVIDTKYIGDKRIVVIDGSRNDIDPFFHKKNYFKTIVNDITNRETEQLQVVVGCTCLENDRLFSESNLPMLKVGDIIKFSFVGAYTSCLSPLFIRYFPNIYLQEGDNFTLVRPPWTEREYLQLDNSNK